MARAPRSASWGAVAILAVATLWVAVALGQLNSLLGAMHVAGSPSFTISAIAGGPGKAESALRVWTAHAAQAAPIGELHAESDAARRPPDAAEVVTLQSLLDTFLLVPLYTTLTTLFFLGATTTARSSGLGRLPRFGIAAVLITASLDVVENVAEKRLVDHWWGTLPGGSPELSEGWVRALRVAATGKWVFAAATLVIALVVAAALVLERREQRRASPARPSDEDRRNARRRAHAVAFQVVIAIAAVILFNQQGQVADLYRRWQAWQAGLTLVALAFAGFALWAVTRRLLLRGTVVRHTGHHEDRLKHRLFLGLCALAASQLALHYALADHRFDPGWGLVVPALIVAGLAVLGLGVSPDYGTGRRRGVGPPDDGAAREPILPRLLASGLVVGFAIALLRSSFGYAVYTRQWDWGRGCILLGIAALGGALGITIRLRLPEAPAEEDSLLRRVVREPVTWAVAATVLGVVVLAPRGGPDDIEPVLLVTLSALLIVGALRWYVAMGHERPPKDGLDLPLAVVAGVFGIIVPAIGALFAVQFGQRLGVPGVAVLFVAAASLVAGLIAWGAPWLPPPRVLARFPAFPATVFLLVWFVAAAYVDREGAFHNARVLTDPAVERPAAARSPQQQLGCWLARHGVALPDGAAAPSDPSCARPAEAPPARPVPLVVVASTGGGIRSAYWTATVLDCTFGVRPAPEENGDPCPPPTAAQQADHSRSDALFALSGISGGSVGMAEYAAQLVASTSGSASSRPDWVRQALEVDGLSPSGARWLFVEVARSFLQFSGPDDRAAVLEGSFERRWPDRELGRGLFEVERTNPHVPLLLFNSTSVTDGCRFNVSVLNANVEPAAGLPTTCRSNTPFDEPAPGQPGRDEEPLSRAPRTTAGSVLPATRDVSDLLCRQRVDLRLSTASLLSARFPYVNPAGRVASRCPNGPQRVVHGVDGGYLDTSGASPLVELMTALEPLVEEANADPRNAGRCVIPFMVQIDNGFDDSSPPRKPRRPSQLLAPLQTVFAARIARAAEARSGAALMFTTPFAGARYKGGAVSNRYAHFVNEAHPGPGAPFGWAQSRFSQTELVSQLRQPRNRQALAEISDWFDAISDGRLTCAP